MPSPPSAAPAIYLTFDDGPNPDWTPPLLDALRDTGAHATFFLIDRHITESTAAIVKRIADNGHTGSPVGRGGCGTLTGAASGARIAWGGRLARKASNGDIIVIHDGHHVNPRPDRRHAAETVRRLVPELRRRGFVFKPLCEGRSAV